MICAQIRQKKLENNFCNITSGLQKIPFIYLRALQQKLKKSLSGV